MAVVCGPSLVRLEICHRNQPANVPMPSIRRMYVKQTRKAIQNRGIKRAESSRSLRSAILRRDRSPKSDAIQGIRTYTMSWIVFILCGDLNKRSYIPELSIKMRSTVPQPNSNFQLLSTTKREFVRRFIFPSSRRGAARAASRIVRPIVRCPLVQYDLQPREKGWATSLWF